MGGPSGGPGGSGVPSGVLGGVGKHLRKAGRGWEGSGVPQESREDRRPSWRAGRVRSPFRSAGRGREALLEGWQGSGGFSRRPGGSGGIGKPCRRAGIGQETLPYGCEGPGEVGSPSQWARRGWKDLPELGGPSGEPGGVGRNGKGWESLSKGR